MYSTIYADPPWNTKAGRALNGYVLKNGVQIFNSVNGSSRPLAYPTMSVSDIKNLPIKVIANKNSHLYMWVTNQYLMSAGEILNAWGFKYSTTLVWAKKMMGGGLGGAFKINTEFLLFATKGSLKAKKKHPGTWFNVKREYVNGYPCHSKKPQFFRALIESVSPGPYIELFAREKVDGWHAWGNEIENDIDIY